MYSKGWSDFVAYRDGREYLVPWHPHRVRWIKTRDFIIDVLKFFGVSIYYRLDMACNIMTFFSTPGTTLYDRRKIVRLK